jgi:hypothetical protein
MQDDGLVEPRMHQVIESDIFDNLIKYYISKIPLPEEPISMEEISELIDQKCRKTL